MVDLVPLSEVPVDREQLEWARRSGRLPVVKASENARGRSGKRFVTTEVAETMAALSQFGLHLRYAGQFIARVDTETGELRLTPRRV